MRISDWSSDVCSSDLPVALLALEIGVGAAQRSLERLAQPDLTGGYRGNGVGAGDEEVGQRLVAMHVETEIDAAPLHAIADGGQDRKGDGEGKSVAVRVDLGGRRCIKNINKKLR